jgi:hypothetical protein
MLWKVTPITSLCVVLDRPGQDSADHRLPVRGVREDRQPERCGYKPAHRHGTG